MSKRLSRREGEILELRSHGLGRKQIAARLGCSESTVATHTRRLLSKLGASCTIEAVWISRMKTCPRCGFRL